MPILPHTPSGASYAPSGAGAGEEGRIDREPAVRADGNPVARRVVAAAPASVRRPVELLVGTGVAAARDRIVGLSAEVAFFSILSLPPLLLTVVAALGFLPGDQSGEFVGALIRASGRVFTRETVQSVIEPTVIALVDRPRSDVVSLGFALSLLSASRAVRVVLVAVAIAYDMGSYRPSWRKRVYALLLTLGLFVVVPVVVPLLLAGPDLGRTLEASSLLPTWAAELWPLLYWFGIGTLAVLAVALLYHLAAPWWTPFRRDLPGALLAVATWVGSSAGLRVYTRNAITGNDIYGFLAGPLALLVWLYLLAFGVLFGSVLNAELERMYPSPEHRRVPSRERLRRILSNGERSRHGRSDGDRDAGAGSASATADDSTGPAAVGRPGDELV